MSLNTTFYLQQCPACGRQLRVCVEYLGKSIQCRHCRAIFVSCDSTQSPCLDSDGDELLRRADRLLDSSARAEEPAVH